ncbi:MAG TPA: polysaccharide deacetylase family protein [Clostridia bacterium]|nr:polysaccharide deacetylase family protein [Clostridia bacterium]
MRRLKQIFVLFVALVIALSIIGCTPQKVEEDPGDKEQNLPLPTPAEADKEPQIDNQDQDNNEKTAEEIDLKKIKANENGQVMILMYHGISDKEAEWVRTADNFRKDLRTLYDKGYRLISLKDYIVNNIKVEAGYTPFVLTFDDGLLNSFNIIEENGEKKIDPDCAVGILEDFKKEHPDFGSGGSFFVFYPLPFRQKELIKEKYEFLIQNGYDVGNHAYTHENLGSLSIEDVQKALGKNVKLTEEYLPGYDVYALALPYGIGPKGDNYKYAAQGEYDGVKYNHRAVLKVGSNPAPSPVSVKFDPIRLPRVRASEMNTAGTGIYDWLAHFDKKPEKRYVSDGNPDTVAIPESEKDNVDQSRLNGKELVIYN